MTKDQKKLSFRRALQQALINIKDAEMAEGFLTNMFTDKEISEFSTRLQIFKRLKDGVPQREIAEELDTSIGTVSRGAREMKYKSTVFTRSLK